MIAASHGPESPAKEQLVSELRQACMEFGFFQLINHAIPASLQESVLHQSKEFFGLPTPTKEKYSKGMHSHGHRESYSHSWKHRLTHTYKSRRYWGR